MYLNICIKTILFLCVLFVLSYASLGKTHTFPPPPTTDTITTIIISGNKKTEASVVLQLADLSVGDTIDTTAVQTIRQRLLRSGLFNKVNVLFHRTPEGIRAYIIVTERFYFLPYDFGGELYGYRYGKRDIWWRLRVGMEYNNFRGKAEVLRTSFSFWDWRSFGLSWYKPLFPSKYYFSIGGSVNQLPDDLFKIDHTFLRGYGLFGRKLPYNSRISLIVSPLFRQRVHRHDTIPNPGTVRVYEAFSILSFSSDHRSRRFDPHSGWYISISANTNSLYTNTHIAPRYFQCNSDLRVYFPGIIPSHRFAFRTTTSLRNIDAGVTHRIFLGGEGSIRGYSRNQFGLFFRANNSFTASVEYRFPIYELPNMPLFPLDQLIPSFSSLTYRLDGALIVDFGFVSTHYDEIFIHNTTDYERGTGIGFGLREVLPELEQIICVDVVWGTDPWAKKGYLTFMKRPALHFYLGTFF